MVEIVVPSYWMTIVVKVDQYTVGAMMKLGLSSTVLASGVQVNNVNCHKSVVFGGRSWQSSENITALWQNWVEAICFPTLVKSICTVQGCQRWSPASRWLILWIHTSWIWQKNDCTPLRVLGDVLSTVSKGPEENYRVTQAHKDEALEHVMKNDTITKYCVV